MNRNRNHRFLVSANDEEFDHINACVKASGLTREQYTRMLYKNIIPRPSPSKELLETIIQLRRIGTNINQIAFIANTTNHINKDYFAECFVELQNHILDIKTLMLSSTPLVNNHGND